MKQLQTKYSVKILLHPEPDGDHRKADITGSPQSVAKAAEEILEVSYDFR